MSIAILPRYTAVKPNSKEGRYCRTLRLLRASEQEWLASSMRQGGCDKWLAAPGSALLDRLASRADTSDQTMHYVVATLRGMASFVRRHPRSSVIGVDLHPGNFLFDPAAGRLVLSDPLLLTDHPALGGQNGGHQAINEAGKT